MYILIEDSFTALSTIAKLFENILSNTHAYELKINYLECSPAILDESPFDGDSSNISLFNAFDDDGVKVYHSNECVLMVPASDTLPNKIITPQRCTSRQLGMAIDESKHLLSDIEQYLSINAPRFSVSYSGIKRTSGYRLFVREFVDKEPLDEIFPYTFNVVLWDQKNMFDLPPGIHYIPQNQNCYYRKVILNSDSKCMPAYDLIYKTKLRDTSIGNIHQIVWDGPKPRCIGYSQSNTVKPKSRTDIVSIYEKIHIVHDESGINPVNQLVHNLQNLYCHDCKITLLGSFPAQIICSNPEIKNPASLIPHYQSSRERFSVLESSKMTIATRLNIKNKKAIPDIIVIPYCYRCKQYPYDAILPSPLCLENSNLIEQIHPKIRDDVKTYIELEERIYYGKAIIDIKDAFEKLKEFENTSKIKVIKN